MKKRLLALFCAITMILACFTGCGAPKNANALYKKINKAMGKLDSVESDISMNIGFYSDGTYIDAEASGKSIRISSKDDYYYYDKITTSVQIPGSKLVSRTVSTTAYADGNMFISNTGDDINQKLYSPLNKKNAIEYINDHSLTLSMLEDADVKEFTENENGTYSLVFSEYSDEAVDDLIVAFAFDSFEFDNKIEDMKVTINTTPEYLIDDITIAFVFSEKPKYSRENVLSMSIDYTKYENVEKITSGLNTEQYTKVDDVRILDKIDELIEKRKTEKSGSFDLELKQKVSARGEKSEYVEKDEVTFGVDDNGYYYEVGALVEKDKYNITYSDGTQTTKVGTKTTTKDQTEEEAKEFITGLIDNTKYSQIYVTKITTDDNGTYLLTCSPNPEIYSAALASMGATYSSGTQTMEVIIKDNNITSIKCNATIKGRVQSVNVTLDIEITLTFK